MMNSTVKLFDFVLRMLDFVADRRDPELLWRADRAAFRVCAHLDLDLHPESGLAVGLRRPDDGWACAEWR